MEPQPASRLSRDDIFYRAVLARDSRFDGKFFVGVKTTGVYCRPICPARPKRENVEFFASAFTAEKAGYRPCLRCRPESAPLSPAWVGRSAVVRRALRLICTRPEERFKEDEFAAQFGMTARHLRRLFEDEVGRTPKRIADGIRLDFARKLIVETKLPVTEIAFLSGFRSVRRFNSAMLARFRRSPSEMRGTRAAPPRAKPRARPARRSHEPGDAESEPHPGVLLTLAYRPPLDWDALLDFYRVHHVPGAERVSATAYERAFVIDDSPGWVRAMNDADGSRIVLRIAAENPRCLFHVAQRMRLMFDLDADPVVVANAFADVPELARLVRKRPGLRIARAWDAYEMAVCTILGQLISTAHARQLAGRVVEEYGEVMSAPGRWDEPVDLAETQRSWRQFPSPERLAASRLARIGTTHAKKMAIRELSRLVAGGKVSLGAQQDLDDFRRALLGIKGIGPWTAEYIALRALGDADAFPGQDLVLRQAAARHPEMDLDAVRPWRGYAAVHLWREYAGRNRAAERGED